MIEESREDLDCHGELNWAEREFIGINLGDKRLNKRMVEIAKAFMNRPEAQIPQAMGNWAGAKGAYRFFDHGKVTAEKILSAHREAAGQRLGGVEVVLAIQDTSFIDYTGHPATEGLGLLMDENHQGLILHATLMVSAQGVPLGLLDMQILNRDQLGKRASCRERQTQEKESRKWLESYRATARFRAQGDGNSQFVNVGDRESDVYDLMAEVMRHKEADPKAPDLLVRAAKDRGVEEGQRLWAFMESQEVSGKVVVEVPRKDKQKTRQAQLSIRYAQVKIKPPRHRKKAAEGLKNLTLWAIFAEEQNPPQGIEPISWMLLTTMPVCGFEEALEKVRWYTLRWTIEMYFKVLKSGCRIEERQLEAAHRLKSCLAVDSIIAWRILFLTMIGRQMPDLPASILFEEYEWKALYSFIHQTPDVPEQVPLLEEMIRQISKLGGFLDRQSDGDPGSTCLWRGMWRLTDISATWKIFNKTFSLKG